MNKGNRKSLIERFVVLEDRDINLKFLFDHLRDYLICGALFFAGRFLISGGDSVIPYHLISIVTGYLIFIMSVILFWANMLQGVFASGIVTQIKFSRWAYIVLVMLFAITFIQLVGIKTV